MVAAPQERKEWPEGRRLLADICAQLFWAATRAWQSSARSLLFPETLGWTEMSTKVPSVQPAASKEAMAWLPAVPEYWQPTGS